MMRSNSSSKPPEYRAGSACKAPRRGLREYACPAIVPEESQTLPGRPDCRMYWSDRGFSTQ